MFVEVVGSVYNAAGGEALSIPAAKAAREGAKSGMDIFPPGESSWREDRRLRPHHPPTQQKSSSSVRQPSQHPASLPPSVRMSLLGKKWPTPVGMVHPLPHCGVWKLSIVATERLLTILPLQPGLWLRSTLPVSIHAPADRSMPIANEASSTTSEKLDIRTYRNSTSAEANLDIAGLVILYGINSFATTMRNSAYFHRFPT